MDKSEKALKLMQENADKNEQIRKHLNTMAASVTKTVTMVDNLRLINKSLIERVEKLESRSITVPGKEEYPDKWSKN